ncbi:NAD(P)-binding protein [Colletotrichum falcatum]|nr:NAD(P)-binding protein [Colletotrichum falcatum]
MLDQALKTIGLVWVLYSAYRLYDALALWLLPAAPLTRYQRRGAFESWAVVTGAGSAGFGLGCAQELALRGFNVVLVGRDVDELEDARALVESECRRLRRRDGSDVAVRLVVLDAAAASARQVQAAVDGLADLDVTVLVNNVGGGVPAQQLRDMSVDDVDATIDLNARFTARLTRLMAPTLVLNGPSLVLNVGSTAAAAPGAVVYSATMAFVASFSRALAREMAAEGAAVDVLCVAAGEVGEGGGSDARAFAKAAMGTAGRAARRGMLEVTPWFRHAARREFLERAPEWMVRKLVSAARDDKVRKEQ